MMGHHGLAAGMVGPCISGFLATFRRGGVGGGGQPDGWDGG